MGQFGAAGISPVETARPEELPGVDHVSGLRRLGGNRALYLRLLGDFIRENTDAVARIQKSLEEGGQEDALREAHTLKGVAANLSIQDVRTAASKLEESVRSRAEPETRAALDELQSALATLSQAYRQRYP